MQALAANRPSHAELRPNLAEKRHDSGESQGISPWRSGRTGRVTTAHGMQAADRPDNTH